MWDETEATLSVVYKALWEPFGVGVRQFRGNVWKCVLLCCSTQGANILFGIRTLAFRCSVE